MKLGDPLLAKPTVLANWDAVLPGIGQDVD